MRKLYSVMLLLALAGPVLAHGEDKGISGQVTRADWVDRLPVVMICILIVVAVDAYFIVPIIRKLRDGQGIAAGEER